MKFSEWLQLQEDGDLNAMGTADMKDDDGKQSFYRPPTPPADATNQPDRLFKGDRDKDSTGAGVLFTDGRSVLLLLRSNSTKNPGTWGLPAGHSEEGESPFQTAERECEEEIGVQPYGTRVGKSEEREGRWTIYLYRVDRPFDCKLNEEHTEYKWASWDKLESMNLHPLFRKQLPKYKQMLGISDTNRGQ